MLQYLSFLFALFVVILSAIALPINNDTPLVARNMRPTSGLYSGPKHLTSHQTYPVAGGYMNESCNIFLEPVVMHGRYFVQETKECSSVFMPGHEVVFDTAGSSVFTTEGSVDSLGDGTTFDVGVVGATGASTAEGGLETLSTLNSFPADALNTAGEPLATNSAGVPVIVGSGGDVVSSPMQTHLPLYSSGSSEEIDCVVFLKPVIVHHKHFVEEIRECRVLSDDGHWTTTVHSNFTTSGSGDFTFTPSPSTTFDVGIVGGGSSTSASETLSSDTALSLATGSAGDIVALSTTDSASAVTATDSAGFPLAAVSADNGAVPLAVTGTDTALAPLATDGGSVDGPLAVVGTSMIAAADAATALAAASPASESDAADAVSTTLPGKKLQVLPIGLGVFAAIMAIAIAVVGYVTYERTKYRRAFRARKMAENGAGMGYGGMVERI